MTQYPTFILAGQSNMVGASDQPEVVTSPSPIGISSWSYWRGYTWHLANDPIFYDSGTGNASAWPTFAGLWMARTGRRLNYLSIAHGGSCLNSIKTIPPPDVYPLWNPDATDGTNGRWLDMVQMALTAGGDDLRAVLWQQGECEVSWPTLPTGVKYDDYKAALKNFADKVWDQLGVPVVVGPITLKTNPGDACTVTQPFIDIHDAQDDAIAEHPHIYMGADSDDLTLMPDCTHVYDVVTYGERWFDALDALGLVH